MATSQQKYEAALHRIQTMVRWGLGVAGYDYHPHQVVPDTHECSPKHLRVGVDSAMASCEALGDLLLAKGVVTAEELSVALAESLTVRADSREIALRGRFPNLRFQ